MDKERECHEEVWESVVKVSLPISEENHLKFKVRGNKDDIWGLVRDPGDGKIIGLSMQYRDFMEVKVDSLSNPCRLYFYRPKQGRHGIKERLEFSHNSIVIRSNKQPWNFYDWSLDDVFSF